MATQLKKSSKDIGKQNVKKIEDWVNTSPVIPLYQGRVNKTQIFKKHNVPKSTLDTNEDLQKLFEPNGPIDKLYQKQKRVSVDNTNETQADNATNGKADNSASNSELELKVKALEKQLNSIQLDLASEEFLLTTGRYIPKLYIDDDMA
jgi:hypothetical protein